jgi:hypothetical protein
LLYHCKANPGEIHLIPEKNDAYEWEKLDNLLKRKDLLDGNVEMLEELF